MRVLPWTLGIGCLATVALPWQDEAPDAVAARELATPGEEIVVPLVPHSGQVVFEVRLGESGPYTMTMDTGSNADLALDQTVQDELWLDRVGTTRNHDGTGTVVVRDLLAVEEIQLVGTSLRFGPLRAMVADYSFISRPQDPPIHGILGFPLFRDYLMTVDYAGGELRLVCGGSLEPDPTLDVPFTSEDERPHVVLQVGEHRVEAVVDTGYDGILVLPFELMHELPLKGKPRVVGRTSSPNVRKGARVFRAVPQMEIRLGPHVLDLEAVTFFEGRSGSLVGRGCLAPYVTTFDQGAGTMRMVPVEAGEPDGGVDEEAGPTDR